MIHLIILPIIFGLALFASIKAIIYFILLCIEKPTAVLTSRHMYWKVVTAIIFWMLYYFIILLFEYLTYGTYAALDY